MGIQAPPPPDWCTRQPTACQSIERAFTKYEFYIQIQKGIDKKARILLADTPLAPLVAPVIYVYNVYKAGAVEYKGFGILIKDQFGVRFSMEFD